MKLQMQILLTFISTAVASFVAISSAFASDLELYYEEYMTEASVRCKSATAAAVLMSKGRRDMPAAAYSESFHKLRMDMRDEMYRRYSTGKYSEDEVMELAGNYCIKVESESFYNGFHPKQQYLMQPILQ